MEISMFEGVKASDCIAEAVPSYYEILDLDGEALVLS
jgi:hypothetical protein